MGLLTKLRFGGAAEVGDPLLAAGLSVDELRATWIAASWLMSYPTAECRDRASTIRSLALGLPQRQRDGLLATLDSVTAGALTEVQCAYVDTFDTRRRGCLYLTYFSHGDTRRRGMALVDIKEAYRAAGVEVGDEELPDHLPVVLEFGAAHDPAAAARILRANRAGLELLRLHLQDTGSPWHGAVDAVTATLPPLAAEDHEAVQQLIAQGPADESVGLDGYGGAGSGGFGDGWGHDLADDAQALAARTEAAGRPQSSGPVPVEIMRGPRP
ncbi:nitrate reductase molybdenum cofactor assembly chaperone [Kribbia dieselivorans]|uniref:nitrate reductase molybdenum cofactor assembly chaperone n=1 Tax=Kribbia dieselivorans TaxID=331526 RepID=UPI0009FB1FE5|nr:nitrate reductase molybdenum cofactor assembly chaperone [Kribbia dieselivorans]